MLRVHTSLTVQHDIRLIALAVAICLVASVISLIVVQRGITSASGRRGWLLLGGGVTGLGIWTTHFAAMLAYAPGVPVYFSALHAAASIGAAIVGAATGWIVGFGGRRHRGTAAGALVGLGLAATHFIDMSALRVAGRLPGDHDLILLSLAGGVALCALAGRRLQHERSAPLPLRSAALLGSGILFMHFVAMSAATVEPSDALPAGRFLLDLADVGGAVVAASLLLLIVAFGLGYHERGLAGRIVADRRRLAELVAALEASEERQQLVLRATNDVIWDWSHESDRVQWSNAVDSVLGYPEAKQGTTIQWFMDRLHPADVAKALAIYNDIRTVDRPYWNDEYRVRHADGHYVHMYGRGYVLRDAQGVAQRSVGALLDVTPQKQVEYGLRWAAHHDPLTGLPNRLLFAERLAEALDEAREAGCGVGLSVIDLDDFKRLNDGRGHAAGDALLCEVARRLVEQVPAGATVARLGGDEFAVIFPRLQPGDTRPETLEKILVAMADPMIIDGRRAAISLSAGAAVCPQDGDTAEELLKSADLALYAAKAAGPNAIRSFAPSMRDVAERQKRMLADARQALDDHRVFPFYQPKVCLRTGEIMGFEALLRWHDPEKGTLGPSAIHAAFGDTELSFQLTDRMLDRVVADMRTWSNAGLAYGRIGVNGSTVDFLRGDFPQRVLDRLRDAGLAATQLELEVTETVLLGQLASNVERALRTLSAAGVSIALDDFGTGYASLTHLKQFPVDSLKIDRSFIARLTAGAEDAAIVSAVIDLARNLGIATVAEGVEGAAQARQLVGYGCDAAQGYFFSRAIAAADVPALISGWDVPAVFKRMERPPRRASA